MTKRSRFVLVSGVLALALWLTTLASIEYRFALSMSVAGIAYILSVWVLFDDLKGIEWITLTTLPTLFVLGASLFVNFLPNSIPRFFDKTFQVETAILLGSILRALYFLVVALGVYGILLIENIFSVASIRTIQLFRAAKSVNFLFVLLTSLFFYTSIFGLKIPSYYIFCLVFFVTYSLSFSSLWSVDLKSTSTLFFSKLSIYLGVTVALISFSLAFWPVKPFMAGLMLTSMFYAQLGVIEQRVSTRVYLEGVWEYVLTVLIIFFVVLFTTSWTGA